MSFIKVDFRTLKIVKRAIEEYCTYQDKQIRQADFDMKSMLATDWLGPDAKEFGQKWAGIHEADSRVVKFKQSLLEFGETLACCAGEYQTAQDHATGDAAALYRTMVWQ